jgi:hypothetical protein
MEFAGRLLLPLPRYGNHKRIDLPGTGGLQGHRTFIERGPGGLYIIDKAQGLAGKGVSATNRECPANVLSTLLWRQCRLKSSPPHSHKFCVDAGRRVLDGPCNQQSLVVASRYAPRPVERNGDEVLNIINKWRRRQCSICQEAEMNIEIRPVSRLEGNYHPTQGITVNACSGDAINPCLDLRALWTSTIEDGVGAGILAASWAVRRCCALQDIHPASVTKRTHGFVNGGSAVLTDGRPYQPRESIKDGGRVLSQCSRYPAFCHSGIIWGQ